MPSSVSLTEPKLEFLDHPSNTTIQSSVYSAKKKQHSLNVLLICLPDGKLRFVSEPRIGANDRSHWKELQLRKKFEGKTYGIIGDGGFYFNLQYETSKIIGMTPNRHPRKQELSPERKHENKCLSQVGVVVENGIGNSKKWKIVAGKYRPFSLVGSTKSSIPIENVIHTCFLLTQMMSLKTPLRHPRWKHPSKTTMNISNMLN